MGKWKTQNRQNVEKKTGTKSNISPYFIAVEAAFDLPGIFVRLLKSYDGCSNCHNSSKWAELQITPYLLNEIFFAKFTIRKHNLFSIGMLTFRQTV